MASKKTPFALVTGSAKRLGKEFALHLAKMGYDIGVHFHQSSTDAERTAHEIENLGRKAYLLPADLRDPAAIKAIFEKIAQEKLNLRLLVNSASIMPREPLGEVIPEHWDSIINLNLRAPLLCIQEAANLMKKGGCIINLSDSGAQKNWNQYAAYILSKAGIEKLTMMAARKYAPDIRVNAIGPGLVLPSKDLDAETWDALVEKVPAKRIVKIEEILEVLQFLIENTYITGQILRIDGGYHLVP